MKADEWYKKFYQFYYENYEKGLQIKKEEDNYRDDRRWSIVIFKVLDKMAEELGFRVEAERGRIDRRWEKGDSVIAIEHENLVDSIQSELDNLNAIDARLKVLITYFTEDDYPWRPLQEVQGIVEKRKLKLNNSEFLLVYASFGKSGEQYDWAALKIAPEIRMIINSVKPH